eukprot:TRINITY_DN48918_c0_g1_i2.p1 TRINITY_DN48918_c0_g1~~TRINITY_DN48918_c0_g1_i2.p1  ORF type:complete len:146 (+),score=19.93 TRINITY_DN48918_c0_g1_i2:61-498(+)
MAFRQSVRRALAFQRTSAIAHSTRSAHKCHIQAGSFASQAQEMKRRPEPASAQELEKWRRGQCAIVTFEAESKLGITADEIKNALAERKIAVTVAPSFHTFDDKSWKRPSVVRLSPTYFNTESEISVVVDAVGEILRTSKRRKVT